MRRRPQGAPTLGPARAAAPRRGSSTWSWRGPRILGGRAACMSGCWRRAGCRRRRRGRSSHATSPASGCGTSPSFEIHSRRHPSSPTRPDAPSATAAPPSVSASSGCGRWSCRARRRRRCRRSLRRRWEHHSTPKRTRPQARARKTTRWPPPPVARPRAPRRATCGCSSSTPSISDGARRRRGRRRPTPSSPLSGPHVTPSSPTAPPTSMLRTGTASSFGSGHPPRRAPSTPCRRHVPCSSLSSPTWAATLPRSGRTPPPSSSPPPSPTGHVASTAAPSAS
mmetsp:Transcript_38556/g.112829  ORF Transcript_38556/g.112829 Transcript_38556/m.112829 type:complete len:281 (+) Transcript_38556:153-995(+)